MWGLKLSPGSVWPKGATAVAVPATWTKTDNPANQAGPATSFTFTAAAMGTADAARITVVGVNTHNIIATGVTVGALTATKAVEESSVLSGLQLWYVNTSSLGTTADVIVSAGTDMSNVDIVVGRLTGVQATPTATQTAASGSTTSTATTAIVPTGGFGIALANVSGDVTASGSWANATQDYEVVQAGDTLTLANTGTAGSQTPTYSWTGAAGAHGVMACWGP